MQLDILNELFSTADHSMSNYQKNLPMQIWQEDDRPSTKILLKGKSALSDAELLSIIIGTKSDKSFSNLDVARIILHESNNNLGEIARLSVSDLMKSGNLTQAQAIRILTAFEIGRRRNASEVPQKEKVISSSIAYQVLKSCISDKPYEEFWILLLNKANRLLSKVLISEGGISGTVVDPKKIFKTVLDHHATGVILGHNHPSGNLTPSEADERITKKISDAGRLLEINVLDHLIIGDNDFFSFADEGKM